MKTLLLCLGLLTTTGTVASDAATQLHRDVWDALTAGRIHAKFAQGYAGIGRVDDGRVEWVLVADPCDTPPPAHCQDDDSCRDKGDELCNLTGHGNAKTWEIVESDEGIPLNCTGECEYDGAIFFASCQPLYIVDEPDPAGSSGPGNQDIWEDDSVPEREQ